MPKYHTVDLFSDLKEYSVWYSIIFVTIDFVWHDKDKNVLLIVLLVQQRQKIATTVPNKLISLHPFGKMVGGVYSLSHVLIRNFNSYEYLTYEGYIIISTQHKIVVHEISKLTPFIIDPPRGFMLYHLTPSIYMLSHDRRHQKYIVGTSEIIL
ncbi:hypothetical protein Hanom_Chr15g01373861 [Helianthus anomalus]